MAASCPSNREAAVTIRTVGITFSFIHKNQINDAIDEGKITNKEREKIMIVSFWKQRFYCVYAE
jgi:hypothetical protein